MHYRLEKRILCLIAAVGFTAGSMGVFSSDDKHNESLNNSSNEYISSFSDVVAEDWFYPYVDYLHKNGIVKGLTETEFVPRGTFTVAESTAIITRYLGLEDEATIRKLQMEALGGAGSDKWFAGYLQLMYETGIIDVTEYGCSVNGEFISIDNPEILQNPVKRCEFAAFVIRSFELENTGEGFAGIGGGFIVGGEYDESLLELYIPHINDYTSIPDEYKQYVLKAYYNGIFNGDDLGNFNPYNNLTRGEMAKVTAVILNKDLRTPIQVMPEAEETFGESSDDAKYTFSDNSYTVVGDEKYLLNDAVQSILAEEAVNCVYLDDESVVYSPILSAPDGYSIELRHYRIAKYGYSNELDSTHDDVEYKNTYESGDTILLVMSEILTGRNVGACEISFQDGQAVVADNCIYEP